MSRAETNEIVKRANERRVEIARKGRRTNVIAGAIAGSLLLGFVVLMWWNDRSPPTGLLLTVSVIGLAAVAEELRKRHRQGLGARVRGR